MKKTYLLLILSLVAVLVLLNACSKDTAISTSTTIADIDGNVYHTVTIGTQVWMVENLKTTHYRNGDAIANVTNITTWTGLSTGAWCDYNNDATNGTKYGHLYNFFAVADSRNIAPAGWHIPTNTEWTTLTNYVSTHLGTSLSEAKALAATTDWRAYSDPVAIGCNLTLNNSTGFSALPGSYRNGNNGKFNSIGISAYWWSSTEDDSTFAQYGRITAHYRYMQYNYSGMYSLYDIENDTYGYGRQQGFSVRCIKN
jgi:uncharacterized protein (TIGR02145 family)